MAALLGAACTTTPPPPLRIAAAADLRYALDDLAKAFRQQHAEVRIEPTYGSSGMFYAQLTNRAPFDLYLSADLDYPRKLSAQGLTLPGSDFTYADGHIVLWTTNASGIDVARLGMDALRQTAVRHIAIANPAHAPYGRAAEAALRSAGIYDALKDKLVMGENISQTFQMAQSGAAEVGIVALSLAIAPGAAGQGHYWEVPPTAYPRIQQGGAIMKWTKNPGAAQAFRAFLLAPEGRAILKRYGFSGD
ncbi:MAG: molybdate ABC transporter substrate-binding protein [Bryobacteraceae bacterium]|jgi:molybdate transport system substrate-binding protein